MPLKLPSYQLCWLALVTFDVTLVIHVKGAVGVVVGVVVPVPEAAVPLMANIVAQGLEKQLGLKECSKFLFINYYGD